MLDDNSYPTISICGPVGVQNTNSGKNALSDNIVYYELPCNNHSMYKANPLHIPIFHHLFPHFLPHLSFFQLTNTRIAQ